MEKPGSAILIVDDDQTNTRLLEVQLKSSGYQIMTAHSGGECLEQIKAHLPDIILLDIMMPEMDGFDVAGRLKADPRTENIPVIMITGLADRESRLRALGMGAEEFLTKPVDRAELLVRVRNMLRLKEYQNFLADYNRVLEQSVAERTRELREAYKDTILTMVRAAEYRDEDTGAHVQRISFYCLDMAEELGLDAEFRDEIFYASPMHDIGKIAIPDAVMLKPGALTPEDWAIMKSHAATGAKILEKGGSPYTRMGAEIAQNHHERWDGSGYPKGIAGEAIPFAARLMNIADQYDALRSKRPYKPALDHERVVEIITVGDGRTLPAHFDPQVLDAFGHCAERWRGIYDAHAD
ncbi:MAG: response regulator [Sulfuritalea sp.]|nr:response regulator [Sulfuritalea sp.]